MMGLLSSAHSFTLDGKRPAPLCTDSKRMYEALQAEGGILFPPWLGGQYLFCLSGFSSGVSKLCSLSHAFTCFTHCTDEECSNVIAQRGDFSALGVTRVSRENGGTVTAAVLTRTLAILLRSGMRKYFSPSPAPSSVTPRIKMMKSSRQENGTVKYTTYR